MNNKSNYRQLRYHIVFHTKDSQKAINQEHARELYAYIMGYKKNKRGFLYRINGMEDHIHILCDLHPALVLADFMRDVKSNSSTWIKSVGTFHEFKGWADGYAAFTYSWKDKDMIVNYIKNQQEHHKKETFE
ncbi:MAG: IS200/IS605 family transposase [Bacteroidales bacterium]|nr:IS200/IS605 family transposase [Bacteroidales bacterium]